AASRDARRVRPASWTGTIQPTTKLHVRRRQASRSASALEPLRRLPPERPSAVRPPRQLAAPEREREQRRAGRPAQLGREREPELEQQQGEPARPLAAA